MMKRVWRQCGEELLPVGMDRIFNHWFFSLERLLPGSFRVGCFASAIENRE
jgi:hypothetical protein